MKIKQTILLVLLFVSGSAVSQTVAWFAGKVNDVDPETKYNNENNVEPKDAYFYNPEGITWDKDMNMWITEKNKIRLFYNGKFHNRAGNFGNGNNSFGYINNTGNQASFFGPAGIVSDANGVLYIADEGNHAIRKMGAFFTLGNGQAVTTFAGANSTGGTAETGIPGKADGNGYAARFDGPKGMVRDASGNFYVADYNNFTIRKISSTGAVTTLAGKAGTAGSADGTGTAATFAGPYGIAILDANNLVVSDADNGTIRTVHMSTGKVTTIAGNATDNFVQKDGGLLTTSRFYFPKGLTVVGGKIYVCDRWAVRLVDLTSQSVSLFAGSYSAEGNKDGVGSAAQFGVLSAMAHNNNMLYVTDHTYNIIKTITINNLAPSVNFTSTKTAAVINDTLTLRNTSTGQPATSLLWTITPGTYSITSGTTTSISAPLVLKFTATGFYTVKLDVTNTYGSNTLQRSNWISVSTIGIREVPSDVSVGVYPNPSSGSFTLQSLHGNYPIQAFEVTDITGKVIFKKACDNSLKESFDISNVQNGFYFIRIITSAGTQALKIQKI